jgi:hypothetical protein
MLAPKAFFSFTEIPAPADHRLYNEWHQLDHRPENLALPEVAWGERWVRSPDCAAAGERAGDELAQLHYCNMYWLRDPVDHSVAIFNELAERSFHWGRRPDVDIARRLLMGFFHPIMGYVAPRVLISEDVVPVRPNRGIHLHLSHIAEPRTREAKALFQWYDQVRIPALLDCPGVAGAWTFASDSTFETALEFSPGSSPSSTRIHLLYLDEDPVAVAGTIAEREGDWLASGAARDTSAVEDVVFSGPLRAITPWEWGWFDHVG